MEQLHGKVAVVTGASKGIGAAIAVHLAAAGASVVVNFSGDLDGAETVVQRIKQEGGSAVAVRADVRDSDDVNNLFAEAKRQFGKVDILVNNAGTYQYQALEAITPEHFHRHFDLNVLGLLLATQEAVRHMGSEGGVILNISSSDGLMPRPNGSVYCASKAAVDAITVSLATELGPRKIRVNSLNPGMVETEGLHSAGFAKGEFRTQIEAATPLGRIGQPDDVAKAAVFFVSDAAGWVTGQTLMLAGGERH